MKTRWTDGFHEDGNFRYLVEDGVFSKGYYIGEARKSGTVRPFVWNERTKTWDSRYLMLKANKKNYERIMWF